MFINMYKVWDFANHDGSGNKRTDCKKYDELARQQLGLSNPKPYYN